MTDWPVEEMWYMLFVIRCLIIGVSLILALMLLRFMSRPGKHGKRSSKRRHPFVHPYER